jgi:hypothetical protein
MIRRFPSDAPLLSPMRLQRLASAFELSPAEVLADAESIADSNGRSRELESLLDTRHDWRTNEAFHFIRWVRLEIWRSAREIHVRPSIAAEGTRTWS